MRIAILDLGTNTFNLLIAETEGENRFKILHNQKMPVKLGEGRINQGEIIEAAYSRGKEAILYYYSTAQKFQVEIIKAFGTSALRTAKNGQVFIDEIKTLTGIDIDIISGDREAELIYLGVKQTYDIGLEKVLILDIGGGSNELIIADKDQIYWKKSYPLGIARLLDKFKPSDPITALEIAAINKFLIAELSDLIEIMKTYEVKMLVGASGSFETFVAMIEEWDTTTTEESLEAASYPIDLANFNELYQKLITSTIAERTKFKGLEAMRIEMIPLACLFVKTLLEILNLNRIIQSNFALKEGVVAELLSKQKS